jgi:hypothetical protein
LVLQKEVGAQDELMSALSIAPSFPLSPTTTRGQTKSAEQQEQALAKSQLGFIDTFAEPLWAIGADLFFPGMQYGLNIIRENRQVWMSKCAPATSNTDVQKTTNGGDSSVSTMTDATAKSEGTAPTPLSVPPMPEHEPRKVASSNTLNGDSRRHRNIRKERSLSSLWFWKKRKAPTADADTDVDEAL